MKIANSVTRIGNIALLSTVVTLTSGAYAQVPLNLSSGWNLLGNSSTAPIDAAATFGDASRIKTVWTWNKITGKWAFYNPSMSATALANYAQDKGYEVLTRIEPKDGFWVNTSTAFATTGPAASGAILGESDLQPGWNLLASADSKTPSQLNQALGGSLKAGGKAIKTAWAWEASSEKWKFFSAALEAQEGTVQADYIANKGYIAFGGAISAAEGFWLNIGKPSRLPVLLRTAAHFVILSKTGITNIHNSAITGNIGASPITAAAMDNVFCPEIAGTIYGVDAAYTGNGGIACFAANPPAANKTLVDNAVLDMGTAFADAAGRTSPDFTELGAGDISGLTLAPGLYKWGSGVLINGAGVTLSGSADDVWIFQIGQNLTLANNAIVTLSGGAQAKNVFWQVSGQATLGTAANLKGIVLSQTLISLNTGAAVNGRLYAQTAVTLQMNAVTQPAP